MMRIHKRLIFKLVVATQEFKLRRKSVTWRRFAHQELCTCFHRPAMDLLAGLPHWVYLSLSMVTSIWWFTWRSKYLGKKVCHLVRYLNYLLMTEGPKMHRRMAPTLQFFHFTMQNSKTFWQQTWTIASWVHLHWLQGACNSPNPKQSCCWKPWYTLSYKSLFDMEAMASSTGKRI